MNYQAYCLGTQTFPSSFAHWLNQRQGYYKGNIDEYLRPIRDLFLRESHENMEMVRAYKKVPCVAVKVKHRVREIMEQNDFIYPYAKPVLGN